MRMAYTIGIDFGTNSARAIVVDCRAGQAVGSAVAPYPSGHDGVLTDPADPHFARQRPADHHHCLAQCVRGALAEAADQPGFRADRVIGIGIDATGSSPLPVDARNQPLAFATRWAEHPAAQCWLWKDHSSAEEATAITRQATAQRPHYLARCGGVHSSEWFWAKIWHCLRTAPEVFAAAHSWVELGDYLPALLGGIDDPARIRRGISNAGHKAMFGADWGGLPDAAFLAGLDPRLAELRDRLHTEAHDASTPAGWLCPEWAARLGLPAGIPLSIGGLDVHYGAIGAGVDTGVLVKVMGTSSCDCGVLPAGTGPHPAIPGTCGVVMGSILPGYYGIEAGQTAVGDIFKWWVELLHGGDSSGYTQLMDAAAGLRPGQSGLLALDWHNGNRNVLTNPNLSGMLVGLTLHSSRAEIYRALIEGTAFGARVILERLAEHGVPIGNIVCCGGLAGKNPLLMQIYADVTGCVMQTARAQQACALGGAIVAAALAGPEQGGHASIRAAQAAMTGVRATQYRPDPASRAVYDRLFALYRRLHDAFGAVDRAADLGPVMQDLLAIRRQAHA
jgi:L-ribulokinase